ncbi:WhiB family transcriptional regulator [Cellulosimicrobium funkei]|nr:WhiB family transcriptional regulator [Cellulosimicrobium funkei]
MKNPGRHHGARTLSKTTRAIVLRELLLGEPSRRRIARGWRWEARCLGDERFYANSKPAPATVTAQRDVCALCPVAASCLLDAESLESAPSTERVGMRAGLTAAYRERIAAAATTPSKGGVRERFVAAVSELVICGAGMAEALAQTGYAPTQLDTFHMRLMRANRLDLYHALRDNDERTAA